MSKQRDSDPHEIDELLVMQAKALTVLAFRNGPIENVHADGRISDAEMKEINKNAVNQLYRLLWLNKNRRHEFYKKMDRALEHTRRWDDPDPIASSR